MKTRLLLFVLALCATVRGASASVVVTAPTNGATESTSVPFAATGTTTCSKGVSAMGVYIDNSLLYTVVGSTLSTSLTVATGTHRAVLEEWDYCGAATTSAVSFTVSTTTGVTVTLPTAASTIGSPASFIASGTTACATGVSKMGIYVDGTLKYSVAASAINTQLALSSGSRTLVIEAWDACGGAYTSTVAVTVAGTTLSSLQASTNWNQWGELPPVYAICTTCSGLTWAMTRNISAISLDSKATQFTIAGTTAYSDVLWSNPVLGQGNTQGLTDTAHTLIPTLHHFMLDTYVYITNLTVTQDLEFDINMYENGVGMEWGTQCDHLADGDWDIWNNVDATWFSTGVACTLNNAAWNRVTIQAERETNNDLLYQTITVNGVTSIINKTVAPFTVSSGWWGMTVNYQMDGNYKMATNTTYLDETNFTYW